MAERRTNNLPQQASCGPPYQGEPTLFAELVSVAPEHAAEVASLDLFDEPSIDIETLVPAPGQSFVDGRLFTLMAGNHVVISGDFYLRDISLRAYLDQVLHRGVLPSNVGSVLKRVANTDKVRAIDTHGAKSIYLNAMLFSETVGLFHADGKGLFSQLWSVIGSAVEKTLERPDILKQSDLQAGLALELKGRSTSIQRISLGEVAKRVLDEGDGYTIVLGNNDVIKSSELVHSKIAKIPTKNKQIDHLRLWNAMVEYLHELHASGALAM